MRNPIRGILMPLFCTAIALISVGTLGDIGVSAASSTPAPKLVQPIKADPRTGAPIRNNSSSGTTKTTSSSTQKGQKTTTTTKTTKTTSKTVTKDLSANYIWQAQQETDYCWVACGSILLSTECNMIVTQDYVASFNDNNETARGGTPYIKKAVNDINKRNNKNYKTRSLTTPATKCDDIKKAIDNNHAVVLSTKYPDDSHTVLCVGYKEENGNSYLYIMDPGFKKETDGVYWTDKVYSDSKTMTYTISQAPASNYGTVTVKNAMYITKG